MVDRIDKILRKISDRDRRQILSILESVREGEVWKLDLQKMKGQHDLYRVRKGDFRIIFWMKTQDDIRIISVERRTDTTYRKF